MPIRLLTVTLATTLVIAPMRPAHALMAGLSPDSPEARVDANLPSSPWTSAVAVLVGDGVYSGVVVAPRHVLTAAHVIGGAQPGSVSVQVNAQAMPITLNAQAVVAFPSASFPYDDLALITLSGPVPSAVEILPVYTLALPARQILSLVGYGASGRGDVGPTVGGSASVKRRGSNVADAAQSSIDHSGRSSLFYLFDFDGPIGRGTLGGSSLGNAFESGLTPGDSGSPAYAEIDGQRWLIGINTFVAPAPGRPSVDHGFGTLGGGMLLSDPRFISWLNTQTQGTLVRPAGSVPLLEVRPLARP